MLKIRPAVLDDFKRIEKLLLNCELPVEGVNEHFGEPYCVTEQGLEIIGVGGIEVYGSYGLLRSVAVSPAWQGKSIGEALVKNRLTWSKSNGLTEVFLLTNTAPKFFERLGFCNIERQDVPEEIQKSSEFSSICPETAIVMVRSLSD